MKRELVILLGVIIAAGYLGILIAKDPGYVLITYGNYSLQSSLWVMLGLGASLFISTYVLLRLTGVIRRVPRAVKSWRGSQQSRRAENLTMKGQRLLAEGEYARARKFLESGAEHNSASAVNYLEAAIAADHAGDSEARETFLRRAEESDSSLARARAVVAAELALDRDEPESALRLLQNLKGNEHILALKAQALQASRDWRETLLALPEIRKVLPDAARMLERRLVALGFADTSVDDEGKHQLYKSLSAEMRGDPACIALYVKSLDDDAAAEPVLRSLLKKAWLPEVVALYGELGESSAIVRLKHAESWQKKHSTDAALQYCLGCIYADTGDASLAKECLMRCIELGEVPGVRRRLGELLASEGQYERAVDQLLKHG